MIAPTGDIKDMTLPWLFQDLRTEKKSGTVVFARDNAVKKVYFKNGEIIYATSNVNAEQLGDCLLRSGKITQEQYDIAVNLVEQTGKQTGSVLIERGFIKPQDLVAGAKLQVKEIIHSLFSWRDGRYIYDNGPLPVSEIVPLQMSTGDIIIEGVRDLEWQGVRKSLPPINTILRPATDPSLLFQSANLNQDQKDVFALVDGNKSIQEICGQSGFGDFNTLKAIYVLLALRMLEKGEIKAEEDKRFVRDVVRETVAPSGKKGAEHAKASEVATREMVLQAFESMEQHNHYEMLGIGRNATTQEIKKAYFHVAKLYHPDRHFEAEMDDLKDKLEGLFSRVHEAYDTLISPESRDKYNLEMVDGAKSRQVDKKAQSGKADSQAKALAQFNEGMKLFQQGNYWGANEAFHWAIRLDPDNAEYQFRAGLALSRIPRRGHEGEEYFVKAIKLAPSKPEYHLELGHFYARSGQKAKALAAYQEALKRDPESEKIKYAIKKVST